MATLEDICLAARQVLYFMGDQPKRIQKNPAWVHLRPHFTDTLKKFYAFDL